MSTIPEIEAAVRKLSRQELSAFRDWFSEFDAAAWDKQFETDVAAGERLHRQAEAPATALPPNPKWDSHREGRPA